MKREMPGHADNSGNIEARISDGGLQDFGNKLLATGAHFDWLASVQYGLSSNVHALCIR